MLGSLRSADRKKLGGSFLEQQYGEEPAGQNGDGPQGVEQDAVPQIGLSHGIGHQQQKERIQGKQTGCRDFDECQPLTINAQRQRQDQQPHADQQDWIRQAIGEIRGRSNDNLPYRQRVRAESVAATWVKYQAFKGRNRAAITYPAGAEFQKFGVCRVGGAFWQGERSLQNLTRLADKLGFGLCVGEQRRLGAHPYGAITGLIAIDGAAARRTTFWLC